MRQAHIHDSAVAGAVPWYTGLTPMHWRVLIASFLGWVFDGYQAFGLIVILVPMLHSLLPPSQLTNFPTYAGLAIGITLLGWGLGGLIGGTLADYVGRKRMMLWSIFLYAVFSGCTAFVDNFAWLCALRFITGLALGSEWSTGISMLAETWPEHARTKGAGFLQSGFGWGSLLAALFWYFLASAHPWGAESWRLIFIIGALPAVLVLYIRRNIAESQVWQAAIREQRWDAVTGARATAGTARPFTVFQLFKGAEARRRTLLTLVLSIVTTVGWWAISSWLPGYTIGLAKAQNLPDAVAWGPKISLIYTAGAIFAYVISGFVIDSIGRRWFLFLTYAGSIAATFVTYALTHSVGMMLIVAPINGFFTLGCAYVWMASYPAELFAAAVRSTALSVVFNAARLIAWVFPIIAGLMIHTLGGVAHAALILGSVYFIGLIVPWFLPETRGHGLR
jgi:MFS family permease